MTDSKLLLHAMEAIITSIKNVNRQGQLNKHCTPRLNHTRNIIWKNYIPLIIPIKCSFPTLLETNFRGVHPRPNLELCPLFTVEGSSPNGSKTTFLHPHIVFPTCSATPLSWDYDECYDPFPLYTWKTWWWGYARGLGLGRGATPVECDGKSYVGVFSR